jgi:hypothetical protein
MLLSGLFWEGLAVLPRDPPSLLIKPKCDLHILKYGVVLFCWVSHVPAIFLCSSDENSTPIFFYIFVYTVYGPSFN